MAEQTVLSVEQDRETSSQIPIKLKKKYRLYFKHRFEVLLYKSFTSATMLYVIVLIYYKVQIYL